MVYLLKDLSEKIQQFLFNCFQIFISLTKILFMSRFFIHFPKATNDICYVLGNGPSLKAALETYENTFRQSSLFCVNMFANTPEFRKLMPANYVLHDPGFFPRNNVLSGYVKETIDSIVSQTNWQMTLFLPSQARSASHLKEIPVKNPNIRIYYFNYTIVKGFSWFTHYFFKRNLGMPQCQNVTLACLFLAVNMGYKKIFLLGSEQSWFKNILVNENNELHTILTHFYKEDSKKSTMKVTAFSNIAEFFRACVKTFEGYYVIEKYAKSVGVKIYNATEGSYVDAFERKKL